MTEIKTHWKKYSNPDYLGSYAFQPGEEKTLTIASVQREIVIGAEGRKEECTVVHFHEAEKPLILNATNGKTIQRVLQTPYVEDWAGKAIVLGVETVAAFGERVDAVRVKKKQPAVQACADCGQIITASGKFTAQQIAGASLNQYGRALCMDCAKAVKSETGKSEEAQSERNE